MTSRNDTIKQLILCHHPGVPGFSYSIYPWCAPLSKESKELGDNRNVGILVDRDTIKDSRCIFISTPASHVQYSSKLN